MKSPGLQPTNDKQGLSYYVAVILLIFLNHSYLYAVCIIIATLMKTNEESRIPANEKPGLSDQLSSRSVLQLCSDKTIWFKLNYLVSRWSLPFQCSLSSSRSIFMAVPSFVCSARTVTNQAATLCFKLCQHMTFWAFGVPRSNIKAHLNCLWIAFFCFHPVTLSVTV